VSDTKISGTIECGGKTSNIIGITKPLRIIYKNDSFSIKFIIIDDDSLPPIIGTPWLKSNRAVVEFDCENLYFKQKDVVNVVNCEINKDNNITKNNSNNDSCNNRCVVSNTKNSISNYHSSSTSQF